MGYDAYHRRQLAHFVNQTSAAVAYDTRILVVDSYATLRRSMRRTAAVVTRVRRDRIKREVDHHLFIIRLLLLVEKKTQQKLIAVSLRTFAAHLLIIMFIFFCYFSFSFGCFMLTNIDIKNYI